MSMKKLSVSGSIKLEESYVKSCADKIEAFFADLHNHIPTVEGSIKVTNAESRLQSASGKSSSGKGKGAAANGGKGR